MLPLLIISTALAQEPCVQGADLAQLRERMRAGLLQGRFEEAEKIASAELSPEQAKANVTYLRGMLAQQNAWSQLKDDDKKKSKVN